MEKKDTAKSFLIGKDHLNVTINPNIDHAFIVTLVVILDAFFFFFFFFFLCNYFYFILFFSIVERLTHFLVFYFR
jgi:hypothetical protein